MRRHTDYTLARRAVLRDLERGRLSRLDVCDAHPELLRAGRHLGEPAPFGCPVCDARSVRYVSYVYGNDLRQANGRAITNDAELARLGASHEEFARYIVEVCLTCRWNHLARRELHGRRFDAAGAIPVVGREPPLEANLLVPPGAVGALDGGGSQMTASRPTSAPDVVARKGSGSPLVMVTAYDAPSARVVDEAGVDMILVGDTLAMVVLGYDDTLHVTVDDMTHHIAAVARTKPGALVIGDLPWMSYHVSREETVRNAAALVAAGAGAVKLEGGLKRVDAVRAILDAEIPVMGHVGLTPQSVHAFGGFRVQGKTLDAARRVVDDAVALANAGCFAVVLECVPDAVARLVTDTIPVPTIGIGAGRHCDGQVLVYHDLLGLQQWLRPKFVRRYADGHADAVTAVSRFAADVRTGQFPSSDETYHASESVSDALELEGSASDFGVGADTVDR